MLEQTKLLIENIRSSVIGEGLLYHTWVGLRPMIYADYTASGRSLTFIEDYIRDHVLPFYANTHSESSATGRQSTLYREQARDIIKKSLNADENYAVIFSGSGATAAINKMINILGIKVPVELNEKYKISDQIEENDRPVIFIGPYEHHSNELTWRETIADVVAIPLDDEGGIDIDFLQKSLIEYESRKLKIGSFSAASNVTGMLSDVPKISKILHQHGALSFWDYAAAAPYVPIDVKGAENEDTSLDALFISPHKFIGGPGTPGLLVVKKELLKNSVPSLPGGGTVSYVSANEHVYIPAGEHREEGGTPGIVEAIRAGLVFQLKDAVGAKIIKQLEHAMIVRAIERWSDNPNIQILGNLEAPRTSIISFQIMWKNKPLHFDFVVALLNDLFGIQVRGGCSCAGPYGHELLEVSPTFSHNIKEALERGNTILKVGWVRLNFNYFISEETFEYLLSAIEIIAEHGWKMHNLYIYDGDRQIWRIKDNHKIENRDLNEISYDDGYISTSKPEMRGRCLPLSDYLEKAVAIMNMAKEAPRPEEHNYSKEIENLRWFSLPEK